MSIYPFHDGDSRPTFSNLLDAVSKEIVSLDNEYVLKASRTEMEEYYISKVIIDPLVFHPDQLYILDRSGTKVDVSNDFSRFAPRGERAFVQGTKLEIAVPYGGDKNLWQVRPSTYSLSGYPDIDIRDDVVVLSILFPDDSIDSQALKTQIDDQIRSLAGAVTDLRSDIDQHNGVARRHIKDVIESKIATARANLGVLADLGIPMKRRQQPLTYTAPTIRRPTPIKPRVATDPYRAEPVMALEEYEHILSVIRSMSLVIERTPSVFASLDEETIRNHFLIQLNGHYEGAATAETFNASGKTDILIRVEDKNVFIAECKFWRGPKQFSEAVDQLLGYLAWRDSKCAILVFNRTKDTAAVKAKMHDVMCSRSGYKKTLSHDPLGDSRYVLVKETDPGREIIITTQLYDLSQTEHPAT